MRFAAALHAAGLRPREIVADGKIHRCRTESKPGRINGWYALHQDGRGVWGDWSSGTGAALGTWQDESSNVVVPDPSHMRAQRDRERQDRISAMRGARAFWNAARPLNRPHPYIENKGLSALGCVGLRTHGDLLVVPVWLGDWIISVQTISQAGEKRFYKGAPVKAGAYVLQRRRSAVTVVVEGLATGLAVYQSLRQASVIVAFDCGNLLPVVERIKPTGSVCFAADNDHATFARTGKNPGLEKARNAADLIGAGVVWPEGIEGTDAADYLKEIGEGAGRKLERLILAGARYVEDG